MRVSTVTRIYDRDFRYLLAQLVPQHRLPPRQRRDIDRALRENRSDEVRREAIRALEALCESDYLEHTGQFTENGNVVLSYRRPLGAMRLRVAVPQAEWNSWSSLPSPNSEAVASPAPIPVSAPPLPTASSGGALLELLPEITQSFTIGDGAAPVLDRLDALIAKLESWLGFEAGRIEIIEDTLVTGGDQGGERARVVSYDTLRATDLARSAVESGARRYVAANGGTQAVAPIFMFGKIVGALHARFGTADDGMDARLDVAAGVIRNAIEFNQRFASLTSIDSLTGVYNRQFLDRQLPVEIERAMRSGSALSMLVIDVDDFKRINDELGHKKGDEALTAIADIIRRNLRKVDMPFRYGGEEIVILLPGTPEFEALHTAERLRRVVSQYRGFKDANGKVRDLSVSVGVAVYPDTARGGEQLFSQADEAMYRAKQRGKNQVVLYSKK
jgi:diguanylate cyclase (GGDEF)-like protein